MHKNLPNGKLPSYLNIYLVECYLLYSAVDFFAFFSKSCGDFIEVGYQYVSSLT